MVLTEEDLNSIEQRLEQVFATKKDLKNHKSDLINKLDKILKEILASREAQKILNNRSSDNEEKITSLEEIHPHGQHATL